MLLAVIVAGKLLDALSDCLQRFCLVILEEYKHRCQVTVGVDQASRGFTNGGIDDGLVTGNFIPLPVALVQCLCHQLGDVRQGDGRLNTRGILQFPLQRIHGAELLYCVHCSSSVLTMTTRTSALVE